MLGKQIFFDPTGKRARLLRRLAWAMGTFSAVVFVAFGATLMVVHHPASAALEGAQVSIRCAWAPTCSTAHAIYITGAADPEAVKAATTLADELREKERALHASSRQPDQASHRPIPRGLDNPADRALSIGFYVNWDDNSYAALKRALPNLDWVIPSWLSLSGKSMELNPDIDDRALALMRDQAPKTPILPMIQNAVEGNWDGPGLAHFLADPDTRKERISEIVAFLEKNHFQGLTIDFEMVPDDAQKNLEAFLRETADAFAQHGLIIVMAVPFDDADWPYETYAHIADYLVLMAYDQHWEEGEPGSIAGQTWFEDTLDKRLATLDPDHTIIAIGGYGYDWVKGQKTQDLTFEEAVLSAKDSEADIDFDPDSNNPHFSFVEDDGNRHDVWFLDGVTAFNEIHAADVYRPAGYALWRLGSEDPSVWSVLGRGYGAPAPDALKTIGSGEDIDFEGNGEVLRVAEEPKEGARDFEVEAATGDIVDQTYTTIPTSFVIQRTGDVPHKLALTFDDGPDPDWTPKILDVLKQKGVHASFFVIGENAEANPDLLRRVLAEGHDIGNHTFTHPNLGELPDALVTLEINANQRLVEGLTGRSMRLFRAPYLGDAEPTTADETVPIEIAQTMGYYTVGLHVDPDDWQKPSADEIVNRVIAQATDPNPDIRGHVILLHDSGGDRSQTLAALPRIIDEMRARGFEFVPVSELTGLTRDQAMPPVPARSLGSLVSLPVFTMLRWISRTLNVLFYAAIWLGLARLLFVCGAALYGRFRDSRADPPLLATQKLQSVLIPAHNEAKVIAGSITRILASSYPNLEVIVIDDGSRDETSAVVRQEFGTDPRVKLLTLKNGGKATALNQGLRLARGEVVIALDADTQFQSDAIEKLVRWFADPNVGAVAGNAKVGNCINVITKWQALEYITSQNLERRALAALRCITVVPGAIGAWRREALTKLGGFPLDTLAEDQDLTIDLLKHGYKVLYDSSAVAWTEAPDSLAGLAKQRFRWAFGTLQCLWKHREVTLKPHAGTLGLIAIPQTWLFQFFFSLMAPIVDLMLIWRLTLSGFDLLQHPTEFDSATLQKVLFYYLVFLVVDLGTAALALAMERTQQWSLLPTLVLQRFGYRQLMYGIIIKSMLAAAFGPLVGWGKLERKATVSVRG